MPTRSNIPLFNCGLSFSAGQTLCADDIEEIIKLAKAGLLQGDTVVSEGPIHNTEAFPTPIGTGEEYFNHAARVGFYSAKLNRVLNGQAITEADFYFTNAGQDSFVLAMQARPGLHTTIQGRITATLYNHSGASVELYSSQTDSTPDNTNTLVSKTGKHGLAMPTPGSEEIWRLNVKYELRQNGFADPVNGSSVLLFKPEDGARAFSLKLYTDC